ncbi:hypothetical protein [Haladaptatus sp. DYSN1]|uniref:DUF7537 family lipoprotein n=1 Tax=unclassified Haladaptatus TaxID=2622732 RepID=UPI0024066BA9|nr:hypothetical protein [Haladaptatus sp. DYSN1]
MSRSAYLSVLLGLLMVLGGCSGGIIDGQTTGGNGDTTTATTTQLGDPYTASGDELDAATLVADHETALTDAGSFTNQLNITLETTDGNLDLWTTTRADLTAEQALRTNRLVFEEFVIETAVYTTGNRSFERNYFLSNDSEVTEYGQGSDPYDDPEGPDPVNVSEAMQLEIVRDTVDGATWTQQGVEEFGGVSVTRYEARGVESFRDLQEDVDPSTNQTFTNAEAVLLVDEDGIVRYLEIVFEVEDDDGQGRIFVTSTITGVGETTVAEPDWTDRARNN